MTYFKIGDIDLSMYVNELNIETNHSYIAQTNANGDTVVDYINAKREIEVGIIPLDASAMVAIQQAIRDFNVNISFFNPVTNMLEENVNCIIPSNEVEYYTIRAERTMFNAFKLKFEELFKQTKVFQL